MLLCIFLPYIFLSSYLKSNFTYGKANFMSLNLFVSQFFFLSISKLNILSYSIIKFTEHFLYIYILLLSPSHEFFTLEIVSPTSGSQLKHSILFFISCKHVSFISWSIIMSIALKFFYLLISTSTSFQEQFFSYWPFLLNGWFAPACFFLLLNNFGSYPRHMGLTSWRLLILLHSRMQCWFACFSRLLFKFKLHALSLGQRFWSDFFLSSFVVLCEV